MRSEQEVRDLYNEVTEQLEEADENIKVGEFILADMEGCGLVDNRALRFSTLEGYRASKRNLIVVKNTLEAVLNEEADLNLLLNEVKKPDLTQSGRILNQEEPGVDY